MPLRGRSRDALDGGSRRHRGLPPPPAAGRPPLRAAVASSSEGRQVPVDRAGLYVPGGRGSYPSTVLMTAVPARVAGVADDRAVRPPGSHDRRGRRRPPWPRPPSPGSTRSTRSAAPRRSAPWPTAPRRSDRSTSSSGRATCTSPSPSGRSPGSVGVPSAFAGPSEIVVVADDTTTATFAAIDVIVQAEHGPDGLAWLITWSPEAAEAIDAEIARLVAVAPRRDDIERNFAAGGYLAVVDGPEAAMVVANAHRSGAPRAAERRSRGARAARAPRRCGVLRRRWPRLRSVTTSPGRATCCPRSARPGSAAR